MDILPNSLLYSTVPCLIFSNACSVSFLVRKRESSSKLTGKLLLPDFCEYDWWLHLKSLLFQNVPVWLQQLWGWALQAPRCGSQHELLRRHRGETRSLPLPRLPPVPLPSHSRAESTIPSHCSSFPQLDWSARGGKPQKCRVRISKILSHR